MVLFQRMRPRLLERKATMPVVHVFDRLKAQLEQASAPCTGSLFPKQKHGILRVLPEKRHYWSPELSLQVEDDEQGVLIRGFFGPRSSVWTMFIFFYALLGFSALFGCAYGLAQISLGEAPLALWSAPVALVLCGLVYLMALFGQQLGNDQMVILRDFVDQALGDE